MPHSFCGLWIQVWAQLGPLLWASHRLYSRLSLKLQSSQGSAGKDFQDHSRGYAQNSVPHGLLDGGLWFVCSGWLEVSLTSLARGPLQATSHNTTANFIQESKWEESESSCQQDGSHSLLRPDLGRNVSSPLMYSIMSKSLGPVDVQREGITQWQE